MFNQSFLLMKKVKLFLACLLAVATTALYAQNITVKGTVTDASNGEPITGAAVVVQGSATSYALTDVQGAFSINAPRNGVLVVSNMGYKTKSVEVNGMTVVNVALEPDTEYLDEVVVTAQGLTRKQKAIGYSAQVINDEQLTVVHSSSLGNSLAGKVAGAQFWGSAGSTFSEGKIILRGPTSYNNQEGSEPIYVIDGTIASAAAVNMDDVESINILKGPSATALYGSRGANGAVIITTKKAQEGQSHVEFSHTTTAEVLYNHIKFQTEFGGGAMAQQNTAMYNAVQKAGLLDKYPDVLDAKAAFELNGFDLPDGTYTYDYWEDVNWGPRYDNTTMVRPAVSWDPSHPKYGKAEPWSYQLNLRDLTRVAWTNTTTVSFNKSVKGMNTRVSFTNVDRPGIFYNSKAVRRSFSISSQIKPNSWLTADLSYRYRVRVNQNAEQEGYSANGNYICDFVQWGHTNVNLKDLKDWQRPDGGWRTWNIVGAMNFDDYAAAYLAGNADLTANYHDNPYAVMEQYTYTNKTQYHMASADVYASLPYNFRLGARINNLIQDSHYEEKDGFGSINFDPYYRNYFAETNDITAQGYLTWNNSFVDNRLTAEAAAFAEARKYDYYYLNSATNGGLSVIDLYNLSASNNTYSTNNSETHYKTRSFFGTATIGWDDLVYLDGSLRYDIDSRLPADKNGYLYGGGSLSFMASKLINAPWLNFWKIRGSLAQVGSTIGAYSVKPTYTVSTKLHGQTGLYEPTTQVNEHILPTISTSYEVGTEFKLFNNRLYGDVNFYLKNTKNSIINATVLPQSGFNSRTINAGLVQNKGVEILLGGTPVRTKDFEWNLSANISKNVNTLVELAPGQPSTRLYGNSFYFYWDLMSIEKQPIGVIQTNARWLRNDDGQLILRAGTANTGDVRPTFETDVPKSVGNIQPDFTGGFNTSFRYKDFTLSAAFDYVIGGQMVSWTNMWGKGSGLLAETAVLNDKGKSIREPVQTGGGIHLTGVDKDGNPMDGYIDAFYYFYYQYVYDQDSTVFDRSYLKMRELALRYNMPKNIVNKIKGISSASVAFVATNPWLIYSAVPHIDPSELGGAEYNFLEGGQAVSTRSFGVTLNVTF